jgi:ribonuclease HI
MAKKGKFYTVWKGHQPGIYPNWKDCKAAIIDFKGAQYKSFPTLEAAKKAFDGNYNDYKGKTAKEAVLSKEKLIQIGRPNYHSISVDAASRLWNIGAWIPEPKKNFLDKDPLNREPII